MAGHALRMLWICCGLAASGAAHAADTLQRGVLLERGSGRVLLMKAAGGIEAVDVVTGATRWSNDDADMPVMVQDDKLLALHGPAKRGLLPVSVIQLSDGGTVAQRFGTLPLPARALVDDRLGEHFSVVPGKADDALDWRYKAQQVKGALQVVHTPQREGEADLDKRAEAELLDAVDLSGRVTVDWQTAAVAAVPGAQPKVEDTGAAVELPMADDGARRFRSGNGMYEIASLPLDGGRYAWRVAKRDAAQIGRIESDYSYRPFEVYGHVLLFVTPLRVDKAGEAIDVSMPTLVAFDVRDGRALWSREIRDTEFRGPYPH